MPLIHEHHFQRRRATVIILALIVPILTLLPLVYEAYEFESSLRFMLAVILGIFVTTALHESVHGVVAWAFGLRPSFHVSARLVYVTFAPGTRIPVWRFRAIVAAPFVLLTPLFLALHFAEIAPTFAWFAFLTNSIGAAGDLLTLWALRRIDRACLVEDSATGFRVYREPRTASDC